MGDIFPPQKRSEIMSKIRGRHTKPEERIASLLDRLGFRYERYAKVLGKEVDFYLPDLNLVIEYRSCFWHLCPLHGKIPKTNRSYWEPKLKRNRQRDLEFERKAEEHGIRLLVVWSHDDIEEKLREALCPES